MLQIQNTKKAREQGRRRVNALLCLGSRLAYKVRTTTKNRTVDSI